MAHYLIVSEESDTTTPCRAGRQHLKLAGTVASPGDKAKDHVVADLLKAQENGDSFAVTVSRRNHEEPVEWHEATLSACICGEPHMYVVNPNSAVIVDINAWVKGE